MSCHRVNLLRVICTVVAGAACLVTVSARAATTEMSESTALPSWGFELRLGPYAPQVGAKIERDYYDTVFDDAHDNSMFNHGPLLKTLEFDWYLQRDFGLLGVMTRVGYWNIVGKMRRCMDEKKENFELCEDDAYKSSEQGNSDTGITIIPVSLALIYRMDLLKRALSIPLVFHVKGGVDYHFWWISADGERARFGNNNAPARGATAGFSGSVGVALNLDWLEPQTSQRGYTSTGMTDSYLLLEVTRIWGDGFGDSKRFDMSDTMVTMAIGVDFE